MGSPGALLSLRAWNSGKFALQQLVVLKQMRHRWRFISLHWGVLSRISLNLNLWGLISEFQWYSSGFSRNAELNDDWWEDCNPVHFTDRWRRVDSSHTLMQNGTDHKREKFFTPAFQLGLNHVIAFVSSPLISPANSPRHFRERPHGVRPMPIREPKVKYDSPRVKFGSPAVKFGSPVVKPRLSSTWLQKLTHWLLLFFRRRNRVLLLIPFIYVMGTLLYMEGDFAMKFPSFPGRYRPGSVYRSYRVFENLWPEMERADYSSDGVRISSQSFPNVEFNHLSEVEGRIIIIQFCLIALLLWGRRCSSILSGFKQLEWL